MRKFIFFSILTFILVSCRSSIVDNHKILNGTYSYYADSGIFFECETGKKFFIFGGMGNPHLERTYLSKISSPGEKVYVELNGYFKMVPKIDDEGLIQGLFVENLIKMELNKKCFISKPELK